LLNKPDSLLIQAFQVMTIITAAKSEQDLYAVKGLRFEKLSGRREGQRSLRLNAQWRLIVILEEDEVKRGNIF
jgi:toxin HigB-1